MALSSSVPLPHPFAIPLQPHRLVLLKAPTFLLPVNGGVCPRRLPSVVSAKASPAVISPREALDSVNIAEDVTQVLNQSLLL